LVIAGERPEQRWDDLRLWQGARHQQDLAHEVLERGLELADERERRFRTPRSFRDVEPPVLLRKVAPNGAEIDEDRT